MKVKRLLILVIVISLIVWVLASVPSSHRPEFLRPKSVSTLLLPTSYGLREQAPVLRSLFQIGYVNSVNVNADGSIAVEVKLFSDTPLATCYDDEICVIHRLHRYDSATIHIEKDVSKRSAQRNSVSGIADLPYVVANGAWPRIPQLTEETSNEE